MVSVLKGGGNQCFVTIGRIRNFAKKAIKSMISENKSGSRMYLSAPLPFMGQKRRYAKAFAGVLHKFGTAPVVVDLFGGSGLLSHIAKRTLPDATVVYNDHDGYRHRIKAVSQTNALLADIRAMVTGVVAPGKGIEGAVRERIAARIAAEAESAGYVDYITLSSSLLFSGRYADTLEGLLKPTWYNNVRGCDFPDCTDYLNGIEVVSCDYRRLWAKYRGVPGVVFVVDPPYLSTEVGHYDNHWGLCDYLDVLDVLQDGRYVFFTSAKSQIVELVEWFARKGVSRSLFEGCKMVDVINSVSHNGINHDYMLVHTGCSNGAQAAI